MFLNHSVVISDIICGIQDFFMGEWRWAQQLEACRDTIEVWYEMTSECHLS